MAQPAITVAASRLPGRTSAQRGIHRNFVAPAVMSSETPALTPPANAMETNQIALFSSRSRSVLYLPDSQASHRRPVPTVPS